MDSKKKQKAVYSMYSDLNTITPTKKKPVIRWDTGRVFISFKKFLSRCLSACLRGISKMFSDVQRFLNNCVEHSIFQQGILLCIFINTFSMGIEYHDQPETLTRVREGDTLMCIDDAKMICVGR